MVGKNSKEPSDKPLVSIVVPTKNSGETIALCLKSIKKQTYPNIEVIVVDNYSIDKTREIAQKYGVRIYLRGPERTFQVNYGVKKANGTYIYRVDSDFVLEPSVVKEAVKSCEKHGYDAIAVHNTSDPTISFWSKVRKLERDCYRDDEYNVAARFFKRNVFIVVGGFDETLVAAEDYDMHNKFLKRGFKIGRIKSQEVHIGEPKSLREIVTKHYEYGKTIRRYMKKNPEKATKQLSPIRLSYLKHRRDFLKHPTLTIGFIVYQIVRYSASFFGYLAERINL